MMKNLLIIAMLFLTSCASMELKQHKAFCRHEALFVGAILTEQYQAPGMVGVEWSKTGPMDFHVQAFARLGGNKKVYFTRWANHAVESPRDIQHGEFYQDQTFYEYFMSQYSWWRY